MDRRERFGQVITEIVNAVGLQRGELRDRWVALEMQGSAKLWRLDYVECAECGCPVSDSPYIIGDCGRYTPQYGVDVWEFTRPYGNHAWSREGNLYFTEGEATEVLIAKLREHRQALDEQIAALEKKLEEAKT